MSREGGAEPGPSRHGPVAQLLIAWSPLSLVLVAYAVAGWVSAPLAGEPPALVNRLGIPLHVDGPADADRLVFGHVPTVWLQRHLVTGPPHWYDALAALVYVTHFLVLPLVTAVTWFRARDRFRTWLQRVLLLTGSGFAVYVLYPAAPPWWAAAQGRTGEIERISTTGWDYLHLEPVARLTAWGQDGSNPVAAMPSLHAGMAFLVLLHLWPRAGSTSRVLLAGYAVAMALTLVYTGEHYVVDVVAGWGLAWWTVFLTRPVRPWVAQQVDAVRELDDEVARAGSRQRQEEPDQ